MPGGDREMMGFETLTLAPIDRRLIVKEMLGADEIAWLDAYHARVLRDARARARRRDTPLARRRDGAALAAPQPAATRARRGSCRCKPAAHLLDRQPEVAELIAVHAVLVARMAREPGASFSP